MHEREIELKVRELSEDMKRRVLDYIEALLEKDRDERKGFKFDWEEGLSELRDEFTSVELQHRALKWR